MVKVGSWLGAYEVLGSLGAGGMGEVYRAKDTRLKREVALKVLPHGVAADPERLTRFQREAEVLASLNHPNIAHLYGLEDVPAAGGRGPVRALVMELRCRPAAVSSRSGRPTARGCTFDMMAASKSPALLTGQRSRPLRQSR